MRAERPVVLLDVFGNPLVRDVIFKAGERTGNGCPGREVILAGADNVEQVWKLPADPDATVILIRDCIDTEL